MIGVFDSGVGGLTVLKDIHTRLPQYSTMYVGDSANAPYGVKNRAEIAELTWRGVKWLFEHGCDLVIIACNTSSAQALREIQRTKLQDYPGKRVLGIIIPTVEEIVAKHYNNVAVLGTPATVASGAYLREFKKLDPSIAVVQHACIGWVPIVEEGKAFTEEADLMVREDLVKLFKKDPNPQAILLACTHYPVLMNVIERHVPNEMRVYAQGGMVANRLADYLKRHPEIEAKLDRTGTHVFYTTGNPEVATKISSQIAVWQAPFEAVDLGASNG